MKRLSGIGRFLLALFVNMLLTLKWSVPAWVLLLCRYLFSWSIKWFWIALAVWIIGILIWMKIIGWATKCGSEKDPPRENKNPYSAGSNKFDKSLKK